MQDRHSKLVTSRFDPRQAAGAVLRQHRQHRDGDQVRIEFDYRDATDASLHNTTCS